MKSKKGLALLFCVVMLFSALLAVCITAYANTTEHSDHCVCGGEVNIGDHTSHATDIIWTAWDGSSEITYTDNTANVYLSDDVTLNAKFTLNGGKTLNLCLNGKKLKDNGSSYFSSLIEISDNSTLNICDCKNGGTVEINYKGSNAIFVNSKCTLNVYGGKIKRTHSSATSDEYTVKMKNTNSSDDYAATFNMYGGEITNENSYIGSCAVYVTSSGSYRVNIYGGSITCTNGVGVDTVYSGNAKTLISGGIIQGGKGAIKVLGDVTLSGSPVIKCTGTDEADIIISTTNVAKSEHDYLTIADDFAPADGTKISIDPPKSTIGKILAKPQGSESLSDKAQYFVSAEEDYFIECNADGNLQLSACAITQQPSESNGYTVIPTGNPAYQWYVATKGNIPVTKANATVGEEYFSCSSNGEWNYGSSFSSGDDVTLTAFTLHMGEGDVLTLTFNSSYTRAYIKAVSVNGTELNEDSNDKFTFTATADDDYTLTITAAPYGSSFFSLGMTFTAEVTADIPGDELEGQTDATLRTDGLRSGKYICAVTWEDKTTYYTNSVEWTTHDHCVCGGEINIGDHTSHSNDIIWTAWTSADSLPTTAGYYYLTQNVTLNSTWNVSSDIYLCLNGKTITGANGYDVIIIKDDGNLTITDCQTAVGSITHAENATGNSGGISNSGTLTLWNGNITGNTTETYGSGVRNSNIFIMYGGSISGNTARENSDQHKGNGGGVYNSNGIFNMYGGSITDNIITSATGYGGGVYNSNGTFNMYGGIISGNTATKDGGGVYNYKGTINMSGGVISGNIATGSENNRGGGVFNYGTFNLSGDVTITGNMSGGMIDSDGNLVGGTNDNVYIYSGSQGNFPITVDPNNPLSDTARVGITGVERNQTVVEGTTTATGFFSDNEDYKPTAEEDNGVLKLSCANHKWKDNGDGTHTCSDCSKTEEHTLNYTNIGLKHRTTCTECGYSVTEDHDFSTGTCVCNVNAPTYTVTIPATVSLGQTVAVSADGVNVMEGACLTVGLSGASGDGNTFTLKNAEGAVIGYTITAADNSPITVGNTILTIAGGTANSSGSTTLTFVKPIRVTYSGKYTGTVTFTVSLESAQKP